MLAGPTASGKSAAALQLAERSSLEIVSADSMQVYRGMDIGTAKPTADERARVPHHLLDVVTPDQAFSVADYVRLADGTLVVEIDAEMSIAVEGASPAALESHNLSPDTLGDAAYQRLLTELGTR